MNQTRGTVVVERGSIADTSATRRAGLLGRTTFEPGDGLWIVPCEGVHTFGMAFPIDILFLAKKRVVRKIYRAVPRRRFALDLLAHSVLELPPGAIDASGTQVGDQLVLERSDA